MRISFLAVGLFWACSACAPAEDEQNGANRLSEPTASQPEGPQLADTGVSKTNVDTTTNASEVSQRPAEERWLAYSNTATSITGDIVLAPTRLWAAGAEFPLSFVKDVNDFGGLNGKVPARVFEVAQAIDPKLLNGNRLGSGAENPTRWIVLWQFDQGNSLAMETFEGEELPRSIYDPGHSGSYYYTRE
ncbi:MAG: hypothetical protein HKM91_03930 [Altererythrobacter sp.]|nr:hypothetical protein [Altererythrobacter sp.]